LFTVVVLLDVAYVLLARGLDQQPPLNEPANLDLGEVSGIFTPAAVGLVLTWLRPRNAIGWLISFPALCLGLCDAGNEYAARAAVFPDEGLPASHWVLALTSPLWIPALFTPVTFLLVRYPSGRIQGRWPLWFDRGVRAGMTLIYLGYAFSDNAVGDSITGGTAVIDLPDFLAPVVSLPAFALALGGLLGVVVDAGIRAFRSPRAERMALIWLLTWAVLAVVLVMWATEAWIGSLAYFGVMVAIAIGVVRYATLGIEVVVRRTLVYAVLTGLVLVVFVGVVAGLAAIIPSGLTPQIVAASLIAVGLAPARDRIQSVIDRLLYGERGDPFAAMRRLGTPMGGTDDEVVPGVLQALADALHVEAATIEPPGGEGVPLAFGGADLGRLRITLRRGEQTLTKADERLLQAVAPLVAAVVHSAALADNLRVEQARVVAATSTERARLRQELHDGLGPSLTGMGLGLEAAQRSGATDELLGRLRSEVSSALEEVRRIIDDLRPTALDEDDLLTALRRRTEQVTATGTVQVDFDAPNALPELSVLVATAAYRIADEALTNVVRHAHATRCTVRVHADGTLHVEVSDDGVGVNGGREGGVGLGSMRERAERLGGSFLLRDNNPGTLVLADLPLAVK